MPDRPERPIRRAARPGRARRSLLVAVVLLAGLVLASTPSGAAPAAAAAAAIPVEGPDPTWAVPTTAGNAAVDDAGTTYLTSKTTLLRTLTPSGGPGIAVTATGSGTLRGYVDHLHPSIAVTPGSDVYLAGQVIGTVTVGSGPAAVTLAGGTESSFLLRLRSDGTPVWGRVLGAGASSRVQAVAVSGSVVSITGEARHPFSVAPLAPVLQDGDGFALGFATATGAPMWLTEIQTVDTDAQFGSFDVDDVSAANGSFAVLSSVFTDGESPEVRGGGAVLAIDCEVCDVLLALDAATGTPTLAKNLNENWDIYPSKVATIDGGYVVLYEDRTVLGGQQENALVVRLDASGQPIWNRHIYGAYAIEAGVDLAVDANGDILLAVPFDDGATIGDGPQAPIIDGDGSMLVEYGGAGDLKRYSVLRSAPGGSTDFASAGGLGIDGRDGIRIIGYHDGAIQVGSGPGAITIPGSGGFVAAYDADEAEPATFTATPPTRLLDSRTSTGGWNGKLTAATPRPLTVAGVGGVPANATAVVLNLTVTDVTAMTYLTAWPTGSARPTASILNALAGDTIANQATVPVGTGGTITVATAQGAAHVVADVFGYYTPGTDNDRFHPITPARLLDSRTPTGGWNGTLAAGTPRTLTVAGTPAVPADATTVVLSVTATDTSNLTYLRVEPTGSTTSSSNLNIRAGQTITNLVTTPIGTAGTVTFTNNTGTVNVVADAVGYYRHDTTGATFHATRPTRVLDSRTGTGGHTTPWGPGTIRTIPVDHIAPEGTNIVAVAANLTATDTTTMSFATLYPQAPKPGTSNLIWAPGQTIAAATTTGIAPNGTVSLFNQLGTTHLILDISGYFTVPA